MNIIDNVYIQEIIVECKNKEVGKIRQFGSFAIEKKLGGGEQGMVFKITNDINKQFALKFYHPTERTKENISQFIREVTTLASLNHKNIVKIYMGGHANWDPSEKNWTVNDGFIGNESKGSLADHEFYYYIMDYIDCDLKGVFPEFLELEIKEKERKIKIAKEIKKEEITKPEEEIIDKKGEITNLEEEIIKAEKEIKEIQNKFPTSKRLELFEILIEHVCAAMIYYHSSEKNFTHKDIKPENIMYCTDDSTFRIVDFGFARHISSTQDQYDIKRRKYEDFPAIKSGDYKKSDMGQFSQMLADILPAFKDNYSPNRYNGMKSSINKGRDENLEKRHKDMNAFYEDIKPSFLYNRDWRFQLKIDEFLTPDRFGRFDSMLRIPVSESLLLSDEVCQIINTQQFQRLRGIRQLGPTMFVFPGATHTRFEHSLGVYSLALRYLEKLMNISNFRKNLGDSTDKFIKLIILSSLLHDIGHYPYSHWIEEIDGLPIIDKVENHEARAEKFLNDSEIKKIIEDPNKWNINIKDVLALIKGESNNDLLNSFLNSIIDIDKVDYIHRDSIHCGVSYGKGIDVERLLDSLYINTTETPELCVTEKGEPTLLSILSARNIMFQAVYWHKTVRACEAMFKRFFYEYVIILEIQLRKEVINKSLDKEGIDEKLKTAINNALESLFRKPDDVFTTRLFSWAEAKKKAEEKKKADGKDNSLEQHTCLYDLIRPFAYEGRDHIYKPAYIFFDSNPSGSKIINKFFRGLFNDSYKHLIKKGEAIANALQKETDIVIGPLDIIVEKTPHEAQYILDGFKIYNTRKERYDNYPKALISLNEYLGENKQAYIFCHPRLYTKIKTILSDKNKFINILKEANLQKMNS